MLSAKPLLSKVSLRRSIGALATVTAAALVLAILVRPTQDAVANGETRSLNLVNMHTGEKLEVTFKRGGRYDSEGLKRLNYFLRDWRRNEPTRMDPRLFDTVWLAYRTVGGREPIHVVSAYRSPETNDSLRRRSRGVAKFSQHTLGKAMDFYVPGVRLADLRAAGLRLQRGGVGFYPTSGSPFVHMDAGSVRMWPRMTRAQLAAVFPDGKTVHIPADGKPMPGYQAAYAELSRGGGSVGGFQGGRSGDEDGGPDGSFSIASIFSGGRGGSTTSPGKSADNPQAIILADAQRRSGSKPAAAPAAEPVAVAAKPAPVEAEPAAPVVVAAAKPEDKPAEKPAARLVATADIPLPERRPADAGPQMVWQAGPAAIVAAADVPLPPTRPEAAPTVVAMADVPLPPAQPVAAAPDETAATQPFLKPRLPVMAGVTGGMESLLPRQLKARAAGALGYAPSEPNLALAAAVPAPPPLVATRFEDLDFAGLSAPVALSRDPDQAGLTRPDLETFATLIPKPAKMVVMRFGVAAYADLRVERFSGAAIRPLRTASFMAMPQIFSQADLPVAN